MEISKIAIEITQLKTMFSNFFVTMIFVFIFLLFQIFVFRVSGFKCFTTMSSTCPNNLITLWNTNNEMSDNLMKWIKSVTFEQTSENKASGKHCKTIAIKENHSFPKWHTKYILLISQCLVR